MTHDEYVKRCAECDADLKTKSYTCNDGGWWERRREKAVEKLKAELMAEHIKSEK